jgi:hypothetical protein
VRDKGKAFVDSLDAWSERMKLELINAKK